VFAPYGHNSPDDLKLIMPHDVVNSTSKGWQHVSFIFKQGLYIKGYYLDYDISTTSHHCKRDVSERVYSQTRFLDTSFDLLQRYRDWSVILGNDAKKSELVDVFFKEVRIWNKVLTDKEVELMRFNQVNEKVKGTTQHLKLYLPLLSSDFKIYNKANTRQAVVTQGVSYTVNDFENVVCPTDSFYDFRFKACTRYPFLGD